MIATGNYRGVQPLRWFKINCSVGILRSSVPLLYLIEMPHGHDASSLLIWVVAKSKHRRGRQHRCTEKSARRSPTAHVADLATRYVSTTRAVRFVSGLYLFNKESVCHWVFCWDGCTEQRKSQLAKSSAHLPDLMQGLIPIHASGPSLHQPMDYPLRYNSHKQN